MKVKRAEIWSQKLSSGWKAKLEFSLRPLSKLALPLLQPVSGVSCIIRP